MSLRQIKDQDTALRLLRNIKQRGRIPSGLLFWGPGGVGKRTTALQFAKAVNCRESRDDACDACLSCRKNDHQNHADVMVLAPTGSGRVIKVDAVEGVIETSFYKPVEAGLRVVVFEDADRMTEPAQNHFLKTLEEPPSRSTFVLLTEQPRRLLPTIRSRCHRVCFGLLRQQTVHELLDERCDIAPEQARVIAALAQGSMARALDLATTDRYQTAFEYIHRLALGEDPLLVGEGFGAQIEAIKKRIIAEVNQTGAGNEEKPEDQPGVALDEEEAAALIRGLVRRELLEYMRIFDAWYRDELVYGLTRDSRIVYNIDRIGQLPKDVNTPRQVGKLQAIAVAGKYIERNLKESRVFRDLFFALTP